MLLLEQRPIPSYIRDLIGDPSKSMASVPYWELYVNGSSNYKGCDTRIVLESPYRQVFEYDIHFEFQATNNMKEYEAFLTERLVEAFLHHVYSDSLLIIGQYQGVFQNQGPCLDKISLEGLNVPITGRRGHGNFDHLNSQRRKHESRPHVLASKL
jgi:hypothetical protein